MMKFFKAIIVLLSICVSGVLFAGENTPPYKGSATFEQLKTLAGNWEMVDKADPSKTGIINYAVTANGSAIVETMFKGTPMEMLNVYSENSDGQVEFVHYCSLGNHPQMRLESANNNKFNFSGLSNVSNGKAITMDQFTLQIHNPNSITQTWISSQGKKRVDETVFQLKRARV